MTLGRLYSWRAKVYRLYFLQKPQTLGSSEQMPLPAASHQPCSPQAALLPHPCRCQEKLSKEFSARAALPMRRAFHPAPRAWGVCQEVAYTETKEKTLTESTVSVSQIMTQNEVETGAAVSLSGVKGGGIVT